LQCTHSCGKGVQHRRVNCHRVNSYGWIDPEQVSHGCNTTGKPKEVQKCVLADCRARYMWTVGPWEAVSRICLLKRVDSPLLYIYSVLGRAKVAASAAAKGAN
jgi:hypothetical protein